MSDGPNRLAFVSDVIRKAVSVWSHVVHFTLVDNVEKRAVDVAV